MAIQDIVKDRIREILREMPGITHTELADQTGLHPNTITRYMKSIRSDWNKKAAK